MWKIIAFIAAIAMSLVMYSYGMKQGKEKGRYIEKQEFIAGTSIPEGELSKRETNSFSTNYVFYDDTYAQVISIYSDLKEAEVARLMRYIYPKECKLILLNVLPVTQIKNIEGLPVDISNENNNKDLPTTLKQSSGEITVTE